MFCNACGTKNPDGAAFCFGCGATLTDSPGPQPAAVAPIQPEQNTVSVRSGTINALNAAYNYFLPHRGKYEEYNRQCEAIAAFSITPKKGSAWAIGALCGVVLMAVPVVGMILGIAGCIGIAMWIIKRRENENLDKLTEMRDTEGRLLKNLSEIYNKYSSVYGVECPVAFDFSHPDCISALMNLVQQGRADTIKEALNVMTEDIHRANMQNTQQQILYRTGQAAKASTASAFFSAANLLIKR